MPLYSYNCSGCEEDKDIQHPMSETGSKHSCPDCGQEMQRVYSPIAWGYGNKLANPHISPEERSAAMAHKNYIEKNKDKINSGEWGYTPGKGLPKEFRPNLSK